MKWNILICNKRKIFNIFNTFSSENLLKIQSKVDSKTHTHTYTHSHPKYMMFGKNDIMTGVEIDKYFVSLVPIN